MKRRTFFALCISALIFGVVASATAWLVLRQPKIFLSTASPTEAFTVELAGNQIRPSFPFEDHKVSFNLYKNNMLLVRNAELYAGDLFDSDFNELYPRYKWLNNSVLWFGLNIKETEESPNSLLITNKTNNTIKYLRIITEDRILAFNIQPNSNSRIPILLRTYIIAEGEFENSNRLKYKSINFIDLENSNSPNLFCLSVVNDSLKIESTTKAGYTNENGSSSENPDVPKVESCF